MTIPDKTKRKIKEVFLGIEEPLPDITPVNKKAESLETIDDDLTIEKIKAVSDARAKAHKNLMEKITLSSVYKLLGWSIFLMFIIFVSGFITNSNTFSSPFFELLKTIILATLGYMVGQNKKDGSGYN